MYLNFISLKVIPTVKINIVATIGHCLLSPRVQFLKEFARLFSLASKRGLRRLKDETAECKYRGTGHATPRVNSSDSTSEEKRQHPLHRGRACLEFDWHRAARHRRRVVLMNLYDRGGNVPYRAARKTDWGTGWQVRWSQDLKFYRRATFRMLRRNFTVTLE